LVASPFATPSLTKIAVLIASASLQKTIAKTSKHDISETARFLLSLTICISPCLGSPWNKVELETSTAANPFEALEATGVHLGPGRDQLLDHCAMAFPSCSIQCCVASARGEEVTLSGMEVRLDGIGSCMVSQHHIRFLIVVCKKNGLGCEHKGTWRRYIPQKNLLRLRKFNFKTRHRKPPGGYGNVWQHHIFLHLLDPKLQEILMTYGSLLVSFLCHPDAEYC